MLLLELFAFDSEMKAIHVSCYQKCTLYLINVTIEHILSRENGMYLIGIDPGTHRIVNKQCTNYGSIPLHP